MTGLEEQYDQWKKKVSDKWLERNPERKEKFITDVGLETKRLYTPLHFEEIGFDYERDLGFPDQYPFTRGITPTMYRSAPFVVSACDTGAHPTFERDQKNMPRLN